MWLLVFMALIGAITIGSSLRSGLCKTERMLRTGHQVGHGGDKVAGLLNAVPNTRKRGDGGVDAYYYGAAVEVIPTQVKMHQKSVGRPDMDKLLGAQTAMGN